MTEHGAWFDEARFGLFIHWDHASQRGWEVSWPLVGGVFSLPQNMAKGASPGVVIIGWLITGIGMLALAFVYKNLSTRKPKLDAGPYAYARAGFGDFIGFNSAWGYWLSAWLGNVSYAVLIFGALSYFVPLFGAEGNTWLAIIGASAVLWIIHAIIAANQEL